MLIIDADSHVIESEATWQYLDPQFRKRRPVPMVVPGGHLLLDWNTFWLIDRQVRHFGATPIEGSVMAGRKAYSPGVQQLTDVKGRVAAMDRMKVARQLVHPSFTLSILTEDPELEAALFQSYNTFLSKACAQAPGRLYFNAVVPYRRPELAVQEIRRLAELGGMASVLVRGLEWDKPLDHPDHYPVFAEAERQGLPMVVHLGVGSPAMYRMFEGATHPPGEKKTFYPPRSRRLLSTLTVQYGFYNLMESTLIDDFPNLKWVFLEGGGCTWMVGGGADGRAQRQERTCSTISKSAACWSAASPTTTFTSRQACWAATRCWSRATCRTSTRRRTTTSPTNMKSAATCRPALLNKMFVDNAEQVFAAALRAVEPAVVCSAMQLWYSRCPVPTASSVAIERGMLDEAFAPDGIAVQSLDASCDIAGCATRTTTMGKRICSARAATYRRSGAGRRG